MIQKASPRNRSLANGAAWQAACPKHVVNVAPKALEENQFELRFDPLSHAQGKQVFPCDRSGNVDLDALSRRDRLGYLFARALVGRDFRWPKVCQAAQPQAIWSLPV